MKKGPYILADSPSLKEKEVLGLPISGLYQGGRKDSEGFYIMAVKKPDFRGPKKGEWYLSGACPKAYKAKNDLNVAFHILKLQKFKKKLSVNWFPIN